MPPKRSSTKRKAKDVDLESGDESEPDTKTKGSKKTQASDDEDDEQPKGAKKSKKAPKEPVKPLDPSLPTNVTFPIEVSFEPKKAGTTRLSCWNGA